MAHRRITVFQSMDVGREEFEEAHRRTLAGGSNKVGHTRSDKRWNRTRVVCILRVIVDSPTPERWDGALPPHQSCELG